MTGSLFLFTLSINFICHTKQQLKLANKFDKQNNWKNDIISDLHFLSLFRFIRINGFKEIL